VCDEEVTQYMAARGVAPQKKYTASRKGAFQNTLENSKRPSEENPPTRCCTRSVVAPPLRDHTTRAVLRLLSEEEEEELLLEAFREGRLAEATLVPPEAHVLHMSLA
jgi:hypothetical protein